MKGFRKKQGHFILNHRAKAVLEGIGMIRAQIAAKEVEIKVMKTSLLLRIQT